MRHQIFIILDVVRESFIFVLDDFFMRSRQFSTGVVKGFYIYTGVEFVSPVNFT